MANPSPGLMIFEATSRNNQALMNALGQMANRDVERQQMAQRQQMFNQQLAADQMNRIASQAQQDRQFQQQLDWQSQKLEQQQKFAIEQSKLDFDLRRQSVDYQAAKALEVSDMKEFGLDPQNMLKEARSIFGDPNLYSDQMAVQKYREALRMDKQKKEIEQNIRLGIEYADTETEKTIKRYDDAIMQVQGNQRFSPEDKKKLIGDIETKRREFILDYARMVQQNQSRVPPNQPEYGKESYTKNGALVQRNNKTNKLEVIEKTGGSSAGEFNFESNEAIYNRLWENYLKNPKAIDDAVSKMTAPVTNTDGTPVMTRDKDYNEIQATRPLVPGSQEWIDATVHILNGQYSAFTQYRDLIRKQETDKQNAAMEAQRQEQEIKLQNERKLAAYRNTPPGTPGIYAENPELFGFPEVMAHMPLANDPMRQLLDPSSLEERVLREEVKRSGGSLLDYSSQGIRAREKQVKEAEAGISRIMAEARKKGLSKDNLDQKTKAELERLAKIAGLE
ncbi:MAG: hypothetical protein FWC56_05100 [Phycisphaerae bacterium]|nr:hypothetical protein [Phycisphaerae bacterium]